ncbi:conserved hypothetical protein [Paecilomyces variotii No. 5]|uniref:Uncharacterized protein n=1 Tax=Byssochlamys spectabilis (strain No. 5 / NBRC 109023) TaxID=1356009 RepID=V5GFT2_BYSSN|nr:conserved hypothetical protein [Paecilomyces variotii No. 5]
MASNRVPSSTSRVRQLLTPRLPRPFFLPVQSLVRPAYGVPARFKSDSKQTSGWTGTTTDDHAINRTKKKDITDPQMESTQSGQGERERNESIADSSKSSSTTERDVNKSGERAKKEHPHAPEPIIGVNDEKGEKGY